MGVAHVVTPGSPRPCHQPNRNPLHPDPDDDAGDNDDDDDGDEGTLPQPLLKLKQTVEDWREDKSPSDEKKNDNVLRKNAWP